ncbi:MmoB/DmpM family protein [Candidatus Mycolicibacterium alkanivorans]|uniref:MmoB/DmpM family protein n=1 Tax=Candidatus Mycolicibacterium alkanivorans TaxID=2954114 RepID=A0ABS9YZ20_9MYCO|nr:MmoB/DmpM family protein [Candidatus Mycolicibacterium alkanivorans]MCI4676455.1 MmoB/DmpM family protein [Candidatus Mycolicibacterium alkanivorans]
MSAPTKAADSKVAMVLMKSEEADATIDVLTVDHPDVKIVDQGPYWYLEHPTEIRVDMARVSEEMGGKDITIGQWLVVMSTFVGRAETDDDSFRVTSEMLELNEPVPATAG